MHASTSTHWAPLAAAALLCAAVVVVSGCTSRPAPARKPAATKKPAAKAGPKEEATPMAKPGPAPAPKVCERCGSADCEYMAGINLAGAEFAGREIPGIENRHYGWPTAERLDYWRKRGIKLIRLPIHWARLQPKLEERLDPKYAGGLMRSLKLMGERDMLVIVDVHNYAKYRGKAIGSPEVPIAAFADLWSRIATVVKDERAVYGYGLMNEPHKCDWPACVQAAVDAIRKVDTKTRIYVANDYAGWAASYAKGDLAAWAEKGMRIPDPKAIRDPSNLLRWELHMYMDHDASGTYRKTYQSEIERTDGPGARVGPDLGVKRVAPFVAWLEKHDVRGLIGEYSVPANPGKDGRWLVSLENALKYFRANCLQSTYWAGGQYWTRGRDYVIGPNGWKPGSGDDQKNRPQLEVLLKYKD